MQLLLMIVVFASPSEVIFPSQQLPLRFSHQKHLAKGVACDFCHEKAPGSKRAADNLIPDEEVCTTCHPVDREHPERVARSATACSFCHPAGIDRRVVIPPPNLRFDHSIHVQKGVPCTHCHDMNRVDVATRAQLPEMSQCLRCHDSARGLFHAPSRCSTCHLTQPDNTLVQVFASGSLRPSGKIRGDAHTLDFRLHHAQVAQNEEKYCASCHRQDFCQACHNGVLKPFDFHGNDYVSRHPIDARRNDPDCNACHRRQSFCLTCHERLGVVDLRTGHAWQAQRNLRQCVACHRQETCLECHASSSLGGPVAGKMSVNPHPPDWAGSIRCQSLADRNVRMCLRCHSYTDPIDSRRLNCQR
jgi:hypothetical protein